MELSFRNKTSIFAKRCQNAEERDPLLPSQKQDQMSQREVVLDCGSNNGHINDQTLASKATAATGSSSSNKLQDSQAKINEFNGGSEQARKRDLQNQENILQATYSRQETPRTPRFNSNVSSPRCSWTSSISRTKSRLIDPPEDSFKSRLINTPEHSCIGTPDRINSLRRQPENEKHHKQDDFEDMQDEFKRTTFTPFNLLQWACLASIVAALLCNLWISKLEKIKLYELRLWEWEIMILVLICGRLVSGWAIKVLVFFIQHKYILQNRVLYVVYGLRSAVKNCIWLGLVLLVWHFILIKSVKMKVNNEILHHVTKVFVCFFVATLIWLLKTILVKVLALSFHVKAFFERIQEALFKLYIIETLSHPPALSRDEEISVVCPSVLPSFYKNKKQDEKIPIEKLDRLNKRNISVKNMRRMIKIIRAGSFNTLDEQILNAESDIEDEDLQRKTSECKAKQTALKIFRNLQRPGSQYFTGEDLMRFMPLKEHTWKTMRQFGAASEEEHITESCLRDWVVKAFRERRELALSLNDTKTAVDELHNILNIIVAIIILIIWLAIFGIPILHFIIIISSQILLAVFVFGNTCRMVFEAIIFLFVMHPFDVGDRCEIDGIMMQVEEMNILTTVFLKFDNQKITYPNNILATKPISNYQRSPDMGDAIDFCIHISTPMDKVVRMKEKIIECVQQRRDHWDSEAMVVMRDVVDLNKLSISLWLTHTMNFQDIKERWIRRSLLIEEMIQVFKELDIEYRLLPLDVNVRYLPNLDSHRLPSTWTTYGN